MPQVINTYNESNLHKTLKFLYKEQNPGSRTEVNLGKFIADIVTKDDNIIEIQTGTLSALNEKIKYVISHNKKIKIVYPLTVEKYISTKTRENIIKTRKSPVKKTVYSIFKELTKLTPYLLDKNFSLDVLFTGMEEIREETEQPVQSKNGRRRYKKNWIKTGKNLKEIKKTVTFHGSPSWKKLIPYKKDEIFTIKELTQKLKETDLSIKENDVRYMVWVFCKCGLCEKKEKSGKAFKYCIL